MQCLTKITYIFVILCIKLNCCDDLLIFLFTYAIKLTSVILPGLNIYKFKENYAKMCCPFRCSCME